MEMVDSFAEILKHLMKERSLSAKAICQATGIPTSTLSEWTAGRVPKLGKDIVNLARFLGVSVEYLVTGKEPEEHLVNDIIENAADGFVTVHTGLYRLRIEKFQGLNTKKK